MLGSNLIWVPLSCWIPFTYGTPPSMPQYGFETGGHLRFHSGYRQEIPRVPVLVIGRKLARMCVFARGQAPISGFDLETQTGISLPTTGVRHVAFYADSQISGGNNYAGLAEVQFFAVSRPRTFHRSARRPWSSCPAPPPAALSFESPSGIAGCPLARPGP